MLSRPVFFPFSFLRRRLGASLVVLAGVLTLAGAARAESIGSGPVLAVGYSPDEDGSNRARDIGLTSVGWRWRFDGADVLDNFFAKANTDFSWAVEPLVGGIYGQASAFEASVVPYVRLSPLGAGAVVPWFEAGIGLAYTSLNNYGLGSPVEFSDNAGIGFTFGGERRRWSIGYRFRHLSHAGLFANRNEGLNAHFLTLSVE